MVGILLIFEHHLHHSSECGLIRLDGIASEAFCRAIGNFSIEAMVIRPRYHRRVMLISRQTDKHNAVPDPEASVRELILFV